MDTINFNLKHTVFHNDLYNYAEKPLLAVNKFLNCRNINIKNELNPSPYCSQDERPYKCNDKYNKIIIALRYNRTIKQITEDNPIDLNPKYHKFLITKIELDKKIRDGIDEIISDYCKIEEPNCFDRSDKKPKLIGARKIEKALATYIENQLVIIKNYYDEAKIDSIENKKAQIKCKMYEPFKCECGYEGIYANKNRHIKTLLHLKKLIKVVENELELKN
jgi:hypothetical protein